ncbi:MAG: hypothetical protein KAG82_13150 [Alcanivoracaceae bacterium]|jgi:hypothetical protein|nr:hypothetical protein [Alcanivoracaceae bacterium]
MLVVLITLVVLGTLALYLLLRQRNMHLWIANYLLARRQQVIGNPVHIMFCFVDHYEPQWGKATVDQERARVARWCRDYPLLASRHADAEGRPPQHTFFYPEEEYRQEHLENLAELCQQGYGEVEIHLHHDNDTADGLREKLSRFLRTLDERHGLVPRHADGRYAWSFIHGNWALDNSRADGRWCGVNNELAILAEQGCYADFTLPSAPSDTQTATVNSLYYAKGRDGQCKSHNHGVPVSVGEKLRGDLMIIQGPLMLNWKQRKWGMMPRIENSDIRRSMPPTAERVDLWVKAGISVSGRPDWLFIKIHTHGTQDGDMDTLLGEPMHAMHDYLESRYNDGKNYALHYVTAREMYNIARAAEAGEQGNPSRFRDYVIAPPPRLARR